MANDFQYNKQICMLLICVVAILFVVYSYRPLNTNSPIVVKTNQPSYVFFDLGVNNGDSLLNFFGLKSSGFAGGQLSYKAFANRNQWDVYAFEANPEFNKILAQVKDQVSQNHSVEMFSQTAAWKYDGTIDFFLDTVNPQYNYWGSSLIKDHPDVVKSGRRMLTVKCVDIARIIKQYDEKDLIVIKMDIEGSEYELLLDFLVKDVYKLIDYMAVEFHPQIAHRLNTTESVYKEILNLFNTKYVDWK